MDTYTALLVNFDDSLHAIADDFQRRPGYVLALASSYAEASRRLCEGSYDLVLLHMSTPGVEDRLFLSELSARYPGVTSVVLTDVRSFDLAVHCFRLGARDYLLKADGQDAMLQRLLAVLEEVGRKKRRRGLVAQIQNLLAQLQEDMSLPTEGRLEVFLPSNGDEGRYLRRGDFIADRLSRRVMYQAKHVVLPPGTFNYFQVLMRHAPRPVPARALVYEAQGQDTPNEEAQRAAKWHIHQLRSAFRNAFGEDLIETIRGLGYRLKGVLEGREMPGAANEFEQRIFK